jgi:lysine-arginine-ornithine-binding protein
VTKKFFSTVLMTFALILSLGVIGSAKGVLKVGTDATYPPFEFQDAKGNFIGFSIDLINAVAQAMDMDCQIINSSWEGIIPGLQNGNYDVIISSMTITEERAKAVNFSKPYFTAGQVIVTKKTTNNIKKASDLKGKKVSVQISTTGDDEAVKIKGITEIKRFSTTPDALLELNNGGVSAAIVDEPLARYFIKKYPTLKVAVPRFTAEDYGIAVNKDNPELLSKINKALDKIKSNGTYKKIDDKWFGN